MQSGGRSPAATSNPMAIGKSSPAPALRTPEGAKLTVTRRIGQDKPLDKTAALTRSLASRTAASGRPTIVNPGKPLDTWTSTETEHPTAPLSIAEFTAANMPKNGRRDTTGVQKHFSRYRKREGGPSPAITYVSSATSPPGDYGVSLLDSARFE